MSSERIPDDVAAQRYALLVKAAEETGAAIEPTCSGELVIYTGLFVNHHGSVVQHCEECESGESLADEGCQFCGREGEKEQVVASVTDGRPYSDPTKPGKKDANGVEWWACDPYPTWYRWDGGTLLQRDEDGVFVVWEGRDPLPGELVSKGSGAQPVS